MKTTVRHSEKLDRPIFYGLCAFFFLIPIATSPATIAGLVTLGIWLFSGKFIVDRRWLGHNWTLPVILLIVLPFVGLLYTDDLHSGLEFAKKGHYWLYAFAVAGIAMSSRNKLTLLKFFIAGVTFTSALFVLQLLRVLPMKSSDITVFTAVGSVRSIGLLNQWGHITFALLITFSIVLLSYFYKTYERKEYKLLTIILMSVQFTALVMLLSDSGHLAFGLLSPLIAYNMLGSGSKFKIALLSAAMVGAMFMSPVTQSRLDEAISGTVTYDEAESLSAVQGRFYMWTGVYEIVKRHPLIGIGTGGYQAKMREMRLDGTLPDKGASEDPTQPHNSFFYMAVSFGIPGVVLLVWMFVVIFKNSWRHRNSTLGFAVLTFTLVLLIGSLTDSQILHSHTAMLFALFTGLQAHFRGGEKVA